MHRHLMTYVNTSLQDRPAGRPESAEGIERDQRLPVKAMEIAKLKALRLAAVPPRTETPLKMPARRRPK